MTDVKAASTRGTILVIHSRAAATIRRHAAIGATPQAIRQPHAGPIVHAAHLWNITARVRHVFTQLKTTDTKLWRQIDQKQRGAQ